MRSEWSKKVWGNKCRAKQIFTVRPPLCLWLGLWPHLPPLVHPSHFLLLLRLHFQTTLSLLAVMWYDSFPILSVCVLLVCVCVCMHRVCICFTASGMQIHSKDMSKMYVSVCVRRVLQKVSLNITYFSLSLCFPPSHTNIHRGSYVSGCVLCLEKQGSVIKKIDKSGFNGRRRKPR